MIGPKIFTAAILSLTATALATPVFSQDVAAADCSPSGRYEPKYGVFVDNTTVILPYEISSPCIPVAVVNAADKIGMARMKPLDLKAIIGIQYNATGTYTPPGARKSLTLTKSRMQLSYVVPAFRFDYEADGVRHINVLSYKHAWDETEPGVGAEPAMGTIDGRIPLIWLTPQGAIWTAVYSERKTTVAQVAGKTTFTAHFDELGIISTTTLNAADLPERTVLKYKGKTYTATFADYKPEQPDYLNVFPARITWAVDGRVFGDFAVTNFRANPYVVFPVPAVLQKVAAK